MTSTQRLVVLAALTGAACMDTPVECPGREPLFESDITLGGIEEHELTAVERVEADGWRLAVGDAAVTFREGNDDAFIDVEPGTIRVTGEQATCHGEGCDDAVIELGSAALGTFLVFGFLNALDDAPEPAQELDDLDVTFRLAEGGEECPTADVDVPAVLRVATDDGTVELPPSRAKRVTIDGGPWHVEAGAATRRETFQGVGPCADCPAAGWHQDTRLQLLLYRVAPEAP